TRPSHRKMHGFIARVDDKIWDVWTPLNGHRCRCTVRSLSEKQAKALGISDKAKGKPDDGWDYNVGKAPSEGLKKAAKHKKTVVDGRLGDAVQHAVETVPFSLGYDGLFDKHLFGIRNKAENVMRKLPKPLEIKRKGVSKGSYYIPGSKMKAGKSGSLISEDKNMTFLHEYGHHIDHVSHSDINNSHNGQASMSGAFIKARSDDIASLKEKFTEKNIFKELSSRWKGKEEFDGLSDIFDSITTGMFRDRYGMAGHGSRYYNAKSGRSAKQNVSRRQAEVFANTFQAYAENSSAWDELVYFFPNQAAAFEKHIEEVLK
ncbi:MAG: phage minor head protein, partial [Ghiorsea sp.]